MELTTKTIAIAGGSGSGKTTLARKLAAALGAEHAAILSQDSYYRDQSARFDGDGGSVNFDHPSALDFELLAVHLRRLVGGESVEVPVYDFATHTRLSQSNRFVPKRFIIVDGVLLLSQPQLVALFDYRVFIDVPEQVRLERRIARDVAERGREPEGVRRQFALQVAPMHDEFVQPSLGMASEVVRFGDDFDSWVRTFVGQTR